MACGPDRGHRRKSRVPGDASSGASVKSRKATTRSRDAILGWYGLAAPSVNPTLTSFVQPVDQADGEDSSSFYGLLARFLPHFSSSDSGCTWEHRLSFPTQAPRDHHPVRGAYTNDLVDTHKAYLTCASALLGAGVGNNKIPAVVARLEPEDRVRLDMIHHLSDWVITLDRFFGVEFYDDPSNPDLSRVAQKYLLDYAPEFLEGLGHRMLVTTSHRDEVEEILSRAMEDLGFGAVEESVGEVLAHLKTVSGRLALRIIGDESRAREAVSLGAVVAYLRATGQLRDSVVIPVDAHPELFAPSARRKKEGAPRARCDLILVRFARPRLIATLIEVKSRGAAGTSEELLHRIADQIEATEEVFRDLFFRKDPPRLDHALQRSRLATVLRFYLRRALRYGLIGDDESAKNLEQAIGRIESGVPDLRVERRGFVVNLPGKPQRQVKLRETQIQFLTAKDFTEIGLAPRGSEAAVKAPGEKPGEEPREPPRAATETEPPREPTRPSVGSAVKPPQEKKETPEAPPSGVSRGETGVPAKETPEPGTAVAPGAAPLAAKPGEAKVVSGSEPTGEVGIELGLTEVDEEPVIWRPSVRGSPHLFILGIPGQGKSWTVTRLLQGLAQDGVPSLVIDFHGQFAGLERTQAGPFQPVVVNAAKGLPFSPFEAEAASSAGASFWKTNCFSVAEIFQYVCVLGDMQRDIVYEALRDCYIDVGFEEGNPERLPTLQEASKRLEELEQERAIRNVLARCRPLLEFGLFKDQPAGSAEFRTLLKGGIVIDVHELGLETLQIAAVAFVLRKVYKDMFKWGEADRLRLAIVLDEAHRLARDITLPKIMKEGRKFGVTVVVASQGLADYHPDVVGNAGTKVVFRTNFPMSKRVAGFLRTGRKYDLAAAIEQLEVGQAYVQTEGMASCARVRMHPLSA